MYARAPGRPKCEYGCSCYQANPAHWAQFDHPAEHERLAGTRGSREVGTRGSKRKQPEVPASDPAPDPAPRRARGDHRFERSEQSEAKEPKVVIDLDNEPDDGPEVAALIRMGFTPALAREAFASSCGADRLATAVQYCQDRQLADSATAGEADKVHGGLAEEQVAPPSATAGEADKVRAGCKAGARGASRPQATHGRLVSRDDPRNAGDGKKWCAKTRSMISK